MAPGQAGKRLSGAGKTLFLVFALTIGEVF